MSLSVFDSASSLSLADEHTENCNAVNHDVVQQVGELSTVQTLTQECYPSPRTFVVQLRSPLEPHEYMGLTGDSFELGSWDPLRSVQLTEAAPNVWTGVVNLCSPGKYKYRYFVYSLDSQGLIQIKRWESFAEPRNIRTCNHGCMRMDRFGMIDGHEQISKGWLINETVVQLKFLKDVFSFIGANPGKLYIKLVSLGNESDLPKYSDNLNNVEVVNMQYGKSILEPQTGFGVFYETGDMVLLQLTIPSGQEGGKFALVLHSEDYQPLGHAIILSSLIQEDEGKLKLNITSPDGVESIASGDVSYLVIKPMSGHRLNFRTSNAYNWDTKWEKLLVGHCGSGLSFISNGAPVAENTIASYKQAYESNADMIELDVHVTLDLIPVVYHDFEVYSAPNGFEPKTKDDLSKIFIKDLTYSDLQEIRVFRVSGEDFYEVPSYNDEKRPDHRLFPTLDEVFQKLPIGLAVNVEIKWPQRLFDGSLEADQMTNKNLFIDVILLSALHHGCGRMVLLSSFDADICTMARLKQNMLPVIFLSLGSTNKWPAYEDPRCKDINTALCHAQAFELVGVGPHAEDILQKPQLTKLATDLGKKVFVWGDDINSIERIHFFEAAGVTANIFDRVDLIIPKDRSLGIYRTSEAIEYFRGQCP